MHVNFVLRRKWIKFWEVRFRKYLNPMESADQRVRGVETKPGQKCEMENPGIKVRLFWNQG